jgi:hypothetical protein
MDPIAKAMTAQGGDLEEVAKLLYGDGAWEYIAKFSQGFKNKLDAGLKGAAVAGTAAGTVLGVSELAEGTKAISTPGGTLNKIAGAVPKVPGGPKAKVALAGTMLGADALATRQLIKKPKATPAPLTGNQSQGTQVQVGKNLAPIEDGYATKDVDINTTFEISKVDTDKRQVFGWASVITMDGKPVIDLQDDYMAMETVEKAAYDYVRSSRKGGDMHARDGEGPRHVSDMIESFVVTDEKKKTLGLPEEFPTGWLVGFQVNDDDTWKLVKDGKRTQFSIHGSGQRVEKVMED